MKLIYRQWRGEKNIEGDIKLWITKISFLNNYYKVNNFES